jgi:hypothetical protein
MTADNFHVHELTFGEKQCCQASSLIYEICFIIAWSIVKKKQIRINDVSQLILILVFQIIFLVRSFVEVLSKQSILEMLNHNENIRQSHTRELIDRHFHCCSLLLSFCLLLHERTTEIDGMIIIFNNNDQDINKNWFVYLSISHDFEWFRRRRSSIILWHPEIKNTHHGLIEFNLLLLFLFSSLRQRTTRQGNILMRLNTCITMPFLSIRLEITISWPHWYDAFNAFICAHLVHITRIHPQTNIEHMPYELC